MANRSRLIMGTALGLATIAVAIDHTRHRLPEPQAVEKNVQNKADVGNDDSPCSLDASPCSLDNSSPCSLDDGSSPCSL